MKQNQENRGGVIEIGTNSVKFLLADMMSPYQIKTLLHEREITRLGRSLKATGVLDSSAMESTAAAIKKYYETALEKGASHIIVFGTHALRMAQNAKEFINTVEEITGLKTKVLTGEEEGYITRRGALLDLPKSRESDYLIIDVGGGSTEIIHGFYCNSLPIGCVNITESFLTKDPPDEKDIIKAQSYIRELFISELKLIKPGSNILHTAVGGTAITSAALVLGLDSYQEDKIHNTSIDRQTLNELILELAEMPCSKRKELIKVDPKRADIIIGGLLIFHAFFNYSLANHLRVSVYNIIHGMFYDHFIKKLFGRGESHESRT